MWVSKKKYDSDLKDLKKYCEEVRYYCLSLIDKHEKEINYNFFSKKFRCSESTSIKDVLIAVINYLNVNIESHKTLESDLICVDKNIKNPKKEK